MNIFEDLQLNQKFQGFLESEENLFYLKNRIILERFPMYKHLAQATSDFDIIRANIIIRSLQN